MTVARSQLVDIAVSRWYHCISRVVRRASLLGEGGTDRKKWIEARLKKLDAIFAVSVGDFAVLDNHLHVLLRLDPDEANAWSDADVVDRWFPLYPPRSSDRKVLSGKVLEELRKQRSAVPPALRSAFRRLNFGRKATAHGVYLLLLSEDMTARRSVLRRAVQVDRHP